MQQQDTIEVDPEILTALVEKGLEEGQCPSPGDVTDFNKALSDKANEQTLNLGEANMLLHQDTNLTGRQSAEVQDVIMETIDSRNNSPVLQTETMDVDNEVESETDEEVIQAVETLENNRGIPNYMNTPGSCIIFKVERDDEKVYTIFNDEIPNQSHLVYHDSDAIKRSHAQGTVVVLDWKFEPNTVYIMTSDGLASANSCIYYKSELVVVCVPLSGKKMKQVTIVTPEFWLHQDDDMMDENIGVFLHNLDKDLKAQCINKVKHDGVFYLIDDSPRIFFKPWKSRDVPINKAFHYFLQKQNLLSDSIMKNDGKKISFFDTMSADHATNYIRDVV